MTYSKIIQPETLYDKLQDPEWVIIDSRFSLEDKQWGRSEYQAGHIPGAVYADLEQDLSDPVISGVTGRHPLPEISRLEEKFSQWGIDEQVQVVVYDDCGGAFAARLWWLLRWTGHEAVAVLDGGWEHWQTLDYPVAVGVEIRKHRIFQVHLRPEMVVSSQELLQELDDRQILLIDARDTIRFLGKEEPIDPVAGHIPGAVSSPYKSNLNPNGRFKSPEALRKQYLQLPGHEKINNAIVYCGSGVTAAHNILAMEVAGFPMARLYAGSWSEWITDPSRPIGNGERENPDV